MQFSNKYLLNIIQDANIIQGTLPEKQLSVSININTVQEGDCFFMLDDIGLDTTFIDMLLSKKVAALVVKKDTILPLAVTKKNICIITVPQVKTALKLLSKHIRQEYKKTVIAIAGTNAGHGSALLLSKLLEKNGKKVLVFSGTTYTIFDIACSIINTIREDIIIIFEALVSKPHEMKVIAEITVPSIAVINTIGHHNIGALGSLSDIATEQRAIFSCFSQCHIGIINGDQPLLSQVSYAHPIIKFGFKTVNQIQARKVHIEDSYTSLVLKIYKQKYTVKILTINQDIILALLSVVAIAKLLNIEDESIVAFVQLPIHIHQFFETKILPNNRGIMINDTYSTDPESMKTALLAFQNFKINGQKLIVIGDMTGLGASSAFWHRQIGRFLRKTPTLRTIITVGSYGESLRKTAPKDATIIIVKQWQDALDHMKEYFSRESAILIKGSMQCGFDNLIKAISQK